MSYYNGLYKLISNKKDNTDIKIYIVDDEEYYLNLEKVSLEKYGFKNIKIFTTAEKCLLEIEKEEPDCVIIDYLLQYGMNGDEFLKIITKKYPDIYVLVLSGQEDISIATQIVKDGAYEYLVKNKLTFFNLNDSLNKIKEILKIEEKTKNRTNIYIGLIIITWILGFVLLFNIL